MVFWDVMFFDAFSQIFKGDAVFIKNEKPYSHSIDYGRSECWYFIGFSYGFGNIRFSQVRFQWFPFEISMQKSCALVEPKAQKQWKSLCESDNLSFLCFFGRLTFRETCENHEISKSIWRYPQRLFGDFHENMKVDVWKIRFSRIALELIYKAFWRFSGSLPCS